LLLDRSWLATVCDISRSTHHVINASRPSPTFHTASDKSWAWRPGSEANPHPHTLHTTHVLHTHPPHTCTSHTNLHTLITLTCTFTPYTLPRTCTLHMHACTLTHARMHPHTCTHAPSHMHPRTCTLTMHPHTCTLMYTHPCTCISHHIHIYLMPNNSTPTYPPSHTPPHTPPHPTTHTSPI